MNLKEIIPIFETYEDSLILHRSGTENDYTYVYSLYAILSALRILKDVPSIKDDVKALLEYKEIANAKASAEGMVTPVGISNTNYLLISSKLGTLRSKLEALYDFALSLDVPDDNTIRVKLPNIQNFDDFVRIGNELKNSLQIPIVSSNTEGKIDILTAEPGSIWLTIALGTVGAVKLVGHLFRSALVMTKDYTEIQKTLESVKRLKLETSAMEDIVNAQKKMLDNVLESEAKAIQGEYYDPNDPEVTNRLKLSIETIRKMANDGLLIRAGKNSSPEQEEEINRIFPATDNPNLVESLTRNLPQG